MSKLDDIVFRRICTIDGTGSEGMIILIASSDLEQQSMVWERRQVYV